MPTTPTTTPTPDPDPTKVDAILCAQDHPGGLDESRRHLWRNRHFGPVLGAARVHSAHLPGGRSLVTAAPGATEFFPKGHPRAGQERYEWHDRGDGVSLGLLLPDEAQAPAPAAPAADLAARRRAEVDAEAAAIESVPAEKRTPAQAARLAYLGRTASLLATTTTTNPRSNPEA